MKTIQEMHADIVALKNEIGGKADVYFTFSSSDQPRISVYQNGIGSSGGIRFSDHGFDFDAMIAKARAWWVEKSEKAHAETVRRMALAVMETHLDRGDCDDAALRAKGFTQQQIDQFGTAACAEAEKLADSRPFLIRKSATGNAPYSAAAE